MSLILGEGEDNKEGERVHGRATNKDCVLVGHSVLAW